MKSYSILSLFVFLLFPIAGFAQKELTITTIPASADIYLSAAGKEAAKIDVGTAKIKLDKGEPVTIEVKKSGYVTVKKTILRQKDGEPNQTIELTDKVVQINASPSDALIYCNDIEKGKTPQTLVINKGENITVEVKKPGFVPQTKTYYNTADQELDQSTLFKLEDRQVSVRTLPQDAAIYVDEKKRGDGSAEIIIPKGKCVTVTVIKEGYVQNQATYCNKETEVIPPLADEIRLKDRLVQISATPEDSKIYVDGKEVGKGSYKVKIPYGKCTEVLISKPSFVSEGRILCNQADVEQPEIAYSVKLNEDEAYQQSEESSIANKNFLFRIDNGAVSSTEAWKKLASIIYARFEEVEMADEKTSYLRTNWVGKTFNKGTAFVSMVRTRVIITGGGSNDSYHIKIQSEISKPDSDCLGADAKGEKGRITPTMDECFEPLDRILRKYSDLISEIQRRFQ